ncbi:VapC toxin family PIN domain ribonuclease [Brachybacterium endophyticum]|uniref:Ribonuclease VapC n=1 Tax=Brachybacterium endophyticum TaxID=2182385 RepID=A0A2U2RJI1_9MICO|nr:TA system VapC family ribonuclease toxin [Brachybacterium endophyticum]PWH06028.1 VapC toxin family PIN domain ribonuclease [Brachybacterium endophyticum]
MKPVLLDANMLIALMVAEHEHHGRAEMWFAGLGAFVGDDAGFAVCPLTEGALVRFFLRVGESARTATVALEQLRAHPRCRWWPDDVSYADVDMAELRAHRQATDVYLAALAERHGGILATFDRALHALRPENTVLLE